MNMVDFKVITKLSVKAIHDQIYWTVTELKV